MTEAIRYLDEYDTEPRFRARVVATERITPESSPEEVRELVLDVDRADFAYEAGQSIDGLVDLAARCTGLRINYANAADAARVIRQTAYALADARLRSDL